MVRRLFIHVTTEFGRYREHIGYSLTACSTDLFHWLVLLTAPDILVRLICKKKNNNRKYGTSINLRVKESYLLFNRPCAAQTPSTAVLLDSPVTCRLQDARDTTSPPGTFCSGTEKQTAAFDGPSNMDVHSHPVLSAEKMILRVFFLSISCVYLNVTCELKNLLNLLLELCQEGGFYEGHVVTQ